MKIQELVEKIRRDSIDKHDATLSVGDINYHGEGCFGYSPEPTLFNRSPEPARVTTNDYAYRQLVGRVDGPSPRWLRGPCPPSLENEVVSSMMGVHSDDKLFIRMRGQQCRAVLSSEYTPFDNSEFVSIITEYIHQEGLDVDVNKAIVGDRMRAYFMLPGITFDNGDHGELHPAIYIRNSEVGDGSARITGGLYRSVCTNGMIYGWKRESSAKIQHRWYNRQMVIALVSTAIVEGFQASEEAAKKFIASQSINIEPKSMDGLLERWAKKYNISQESADDWRGASIGNAGEYGRPNEVTLMDVINGATYVAQRQDDPEPFERMAGAMLEGVSITRDGRVSW